MSNRAVITFAPFVLERDNFFVLPLLDDFGRHFSAGNERIAMSDMLAVGEHQHFAEGRGLPRIDIQKIDIHRVAFRDAILPSASLDDCVGHWFFRGEKAAQIHTEGRGAQAKMSVAAAVSGGSYNAEISNTISPLGGCAS